MADKAGSSSSRTPGGPSFKSDSLATNISNTPADAAAAALAALRSAAGVNEPIRPPSDGDDDDESGFHRTLSEVPSLESQEDTPTTVTLTDDVYPANDDDDDAEPTVETKDAATQEPTEFQFPTTWEEVKDFITETDWLGAIVAFLGFFYNFPSGVWNGLKLFGGIKPGEPPPERRKKPKKKKGSPNTKGGKDGSSPKDSSAPPSGEASSGNRSSSGKSKSTEPKTKKDKTPMTRLKDEVDEALSPTKKYSPLSTLASGFTRGDFTEVFSALEDSSAKKSSSVGGKTNTGKSGRSGTTGDGPSKSGKSGGTEATSRGSKSTAKGQGDKSKSDGEKGPHPRSKEIHNIHSVVTSLENMPNIVDGKYGQETPKASAKSSASGGAKAPVDDVRSGSKSGSSKKTTSASDKSGAGTGSSGFSGTGELATGDKKESRQ